MGSFELNLGVTTPHQNIFTEQNNRASQDTYKQTFTLGGDSDRSGIAPFINVEPSLDLYSAENVGEKKRDVIVSIGARATLPTQPLESGRPAYKTFVYTDEDGNQTNPAFNPSEYRNWNQTYLVDILGKVRLSVGQYDAQDLWDNQGITLSAGLGGTAMFDSGELFAGNDVVMANTDDYRTTLLLNGTIGFTKGPLMFELGASRYATNQPAIDLGGISPVTMKRNTPVEASISIDLAALAQSQSE